MVVINDSGPSITTVGGSINVCYIELFHCYTELLNKCYFKWLKDETEASFSGVCMRVSINAIDKLTFVHLARRKPEEAEWESRLGANIVNV